MPDRRYIFLYDGLLKVKPRWQARWAERSRKVRVVDLGILLVTWWSREDIERYR